MAADLWKLYRIMLESRLFEEVSAQLWHDGLISGELHLGTGEEAINAGIVTQLLPGDALALDHRGTAPILMRGVDPVLVLKELLGFSDGLCKGRGGHMHLFSKEYISASSGIVGASGPTAAGFALSRQYLYPGSIAVAFFGDGAVNQGMLMESMNLAAAWKLPVLFVCKDDNWSITTNSKNVTGGSIEARALGFGLDYLRVDGRDVTQVHQTAGQALERLRNGGSPVFLHATCVHIEAHFLGYQLLRVSRRPLKEIPGLAGPLLKAFLQPGGTSWQKRWSGVMQVNQSLFETFRDPRTSSENDPVVRARLGLMDDHAGVEQLEADISKKINLVLADALRGSSL